MSESKHPRILLDRIFPFHFSVDGSGHIRDLGPRLREIAGDALSSVLATLVFMLSRRQQANRENYALAA